MEAVNKHLQRHGSNYRSGRMTTEQIMTRAEQASNFIHSEYWDLMSNMLTGMVNSEFEEMLSDDSHLALNRASVVVARKMLRMPYIDIEQGKAAVRAVEDHQTASGGRI